MDEEGAAQNSQPLPALEYHVANNNHKVWITFKSKTMQNIADKTEYNEVYNLDIGLSNDEEKKNENENDINWQNVARINKNILLYSYNISYLDTGKMNMINVRISSMNDLGYSQYSPVKAYKINKVSESQIIISESQIIHTKMRPLIRSELT